MALTTNKERYYSIYVWRGVEPQLHGPYKTPEERLNAAVQIWDADEACRRDDTIFKLTITPNSEPEVLPYASAELDARVDAEVAPGQPACSAANRAVRRMRGPFLPLREILDDVAGEIECSAMCCHEALQDYWERNDDGFEAMQSGLERALGLLGYWATPSEIENGSTTTGRGMNPKMTMKNDFRFSIRQNNCFNHQAPRDRDLARHQMQQAKPRQNESTDRSVTK